MMKSRSALIAFAVALAPAGASVQAAELNEDRFYAGGGISDNDAGSEDATGYQFFAGYELPGDIGRADTAVEAGYWNSGDFDAGPPGSGGDADADGLWANGVLSLPVGPRVELIGRAGLDFGDDDGLMAGGGVGFDLGQALQLRGEYVVRDDTDSLQANLVYSF